MRLVAHAKLERPYDQLRRDLQLLELDENHLRIGVMRDNSEGPWWLIWNFVSKEYADNYVPEDQPDPEPTLPDGWQDMVSEVVTSEIKWTMSPDVPFDWANLDGSLMNNFTAGNYPDWATVVDGLENLSMTLNSADMTYTFEMPDGTTTSGTYTLMKTVSIRSVPVCRLIIRAISECSVLRQKTNCVS